MSKLSISRAWEESKAVLASDGKLIGTVALALFVLPGLVLNLAMPRTHSSEFPQPGPWMVIGLAAVLISLLGQLSMIRLAIGPHVSVGEAIAHGARRILYGMSGVDEIDPNKVLAWPTEDSPQPQQDPEDTLWGRSRDFDWGD